MTPTSHWSAHTSNVLPCFSSTTGQPVIALSPLMQNVRQVSHKFLFQSPWLIPTLICDIGSTNSERNTLQTVPSGLVTPEGSNKQAM